ncbi:hypothetical protein [Agromyces binzhouensis]|uniref:hypothetical protein n=1 Tax=Agromyces binzhouensis TaxID=1817495 RepID=UPI003633B497
MRTTSFRCRIGIHKWVLHREPDTEPYYECARCAKVRVVELTMIGMGDGGMLG